jgi:DNA-directed RNA polymerase specialized sigma24 family protein
MMTSEPGVAEPSPEVMFECFVHDVEPRLRRALVAAYGSQRGREATAEALSWAWENWDRVRAMTYPHRYLFRVGRSRTRARRQPVVFDVNTAREPSVEPGLGPALARLSERQRIAVVLVHGFGWTHREVAELTGSRPTTVQNHLERGLRKLRTDLEAHHDRLG